MSVANSIRRTRHVGLCEGVSFLLLIGVAMPLKYFAGKPEYVTWVGWAHGLLFVLYGLAALHSWRVATWPFARVLKLFAASLLPFGPFLVDPELRREEDRARRGPKVDAAQG